MKITKRVVIELILILLIKLSMEIIYISNISVFYAYNGFYLSLNQFKLFESYFILFILFMFMDKDERKFSSIVIRMLLLIMVIPTLSLYALKDLPRIFLYFFSFSFLLTLILIRLPTIKLIKLKVNPTFGKMLLVVISLVTYVILLGLNGIPTLKALDLLSVYEIRSEVNYGPTFMGYFVNWQAKIINMFLFGFAFYYRKYFLMFFAFGLQVLLFLITGHKSFLFLPLFIFAVIYVVERRKMFTLSMLGILIVWAASYIYYLFNGSILYISLFVRRVFLVPAQNYFYYYDFFSENPFMYLSHSILKYFVDKPYEMHIPNLIGQVYYNNENTWVNTGYLGDAYMNFGFLGMILFSILLGFILLLIDSVSKMIPLAIVIATLLGGFFSLVDGALLTNLLTNGILVGIIILIFYSNVDSNNEYGKDISYQ